MEIKKILVIYLFLFCTGSLFAQQQLTQAEYFIDADPGYGSGVNIPITAGTTIDVNFTIPLTNVSDGFHYVTFRVKDANNRWSVVHTRPFFKESLTEKQLFNIVAMEYFVDADPGYGLGTSVSVTSGLTMERSFTIPLTNVSDGFHNVTFRVKDANNQWSVVHTRPFFKESLTEKQLFNIVAIEYFIDADPGYGSGTSVSLTAGLTMDRSFTITLPSSVSDGFHYVTVRVKDANNQWSVVHTRPFFKESLTEKQLFNIVAMEYFINTDPGYGSGVSVPVTSSNSIVIPFNAALGNLPVGNHTIYVRVKDANNQWSVVGSSIFRVSDTFALISSQTPTEWCKTAPFTISYQAFGTYNSGNVFRAELSDSLGRFDSPTVLGSVTAVGSGSISATIPSTVEYSSGYRIRVVSSSPSIVDNPGVSFGVVEVCPPPCPTSVRLSGGTDNILSGVLIKEANAQTGILVATNKISGSSRVTYLAGRSITLEPGFEAGNGTVFIAQKGGCE